MPAGAHGETNADLHRPLIRRVRHDAIDAKNREHQP